MRGHQVNEGSTTRPLTAVSQEAARPGETINPAPGDGFVLQRTSQVQTGRPSLNEAALLILHAAESRGACRDDLTSAMHHLDALGLLERPARCPDR